MIKRVFCKSNYKGFKAGKIYEACREDDNYTGDLEISAASVFDNLSTTIKVINGELVDKKHFKLLRRCYEEYECQGTLGALNDC